MKYLYALLALALAAVPASACGYGAVAYQVQAFVPVTYVYAQPVAYAAPVAAPAPCATAVEVAAPAYASAYASTFSSGYGVGLYSSRFFGFHRFHGSNFYGRGFRRGFGGAAVAGVEVNVGRRGVFGRRNAVQVVTPGAVVNVGGRRGLFGRRK